MHSLAAEDSRGPAKGREDDEHSLPLTGYTPASRCWMSKANSNGCPVEEEGCARLSSVGALVVGVGEGREGEEAQLGGEPSDTYTSQETAPTPPPLFFFFSAPSFPHGS